MIRICRLVRAGHSKGADIILLQVCADHIYDCWNSIALNYCIEKMDFVYFYRNCLRGITSVKLRGRISFSALSLMRAIPPFSGS